MNLLVRLTSLRYSSQHLTSYTQVQQYSSLSDLGAGTESLFWDGESMEFRAI